MKNFKYDHIYALTCHCIVRMKTRICEHMRIDDVHVTSSGAMSFTFYGDIDAANALRRSMISESKSLSIDTLCIKKNTTCVPDEMIAHKLCMIPLKGREHILPILGNQERGVSNCVKFHLHVYGRACTSDDLESDCKHVHPVMTFDLLPMKKDQELHVCAEAVLGTGKKHVMFCPAVAVAYKKITDTEFLFTFETTGAATHKQILSDAIQSIIESVIVARHNFCAV